MGRPVGVAVDTRGGVLVADDVGNVVWRVSGRSPHDVALTLGHYPIGGSESSVAACGRGGSWVAAGAVYAGDDGRSWNSGLVANARGSASARCMLPGFNGLIGGPSLPGASPAKWTISCG